MPIEKGDIVQVEYVGSYDDGTIFETTEGLGKPLVFEIGTQQLVKGFEDALIGHEVGDIVEVRIPTEEAFGERHPELVQVIAREDFPPGEEEPKPGMRLKLMDPNGLNSSDVWVKEVTENSVTLDLNHPAAGKALNFEIKILEKNGDLEPQFLSNQNLFGLSCDGSCGHDHDHEQN
jgi:peptidylprolyl isomerase